jgi:hypothetical protein
MPPAATRLYFLNAVLLFVISSPLTAAPDPPPFKNTTLENPTISIDIYLPDPQAGFYQALRYDHAGMVAQARFQGHTFFGELNKPHNPKINDHGAGTVEEFGMALASPLGYDTAKPGDPFLKIGVALLEKSKDAPYEFAADYKVLAWPAWTIKTEKDSIEFTQSASSPAGFAYDYTKRITLTPTGFRITRQLKNTGKEKWTTDHYGHNYISIDNRPITPDYHVNLSYDPQIAEQSGPKPTLTARQLNPAENLKPKEAIWTRLTGFDNTTPNQMRIENTASKAGIEITTDQPIQRWVLYATQAAFCPEAFVKFELQPNQSTRWTTEYRFYTTP